MAEETQMDMDEGDLIDQSLLDNLDHLQEQDDELEKILQQVPQIPQSTRSVTTVVPQKSPPPKPSTRETPPKRQPEPEPEPAQKQASRITSIESLRKRNRPIRYFVMKCISHTNLQIAIEKNIWSTQPHNEVKLNDAFRDHEVILIFSVNLSQGFQGYARMASRIGSKQSSVWEHNVEILGGLFRLEWVCNKEVPFRQTERLCNPLNENKPVKISRDGQEIQSEIGYQLCKVLDAGAVYDPVKAAAAQAATVPYHSTMNSRGGIHGDNRGSRPPRPQPTMKPPRNHSPPRHHPEPAPKRSSNKPPREGPEMDLANMSYEDYVRLQGEKPREGRSASPKRSSPRKPSPRRASPKRQSPRRASPPRRASHSPPRNKTTRTTDYRQRSPPRKRSHSRSPTRSRYVPNHLSGSHQDRSRSLSPRSSSRRHSKKTERAEPYPSGRLDRRRDSRDERDRSPPRRGERDARDDRYRGRPDYGYSSRGDYGSSSYYPPMDPYAMQYFLMWKHAQSSGYNGRRDYR